MGVYVWKHKTQFIMSSKLFSIYVKLEYSVHASVSPSILWAWGFELRSLGFAANTVATIFLVCTWLFQYTSFHMIYSFLIIICKVCLYITI